MRQHWQVTDRHGTVWHCELLRLRLTSQRGAGGHQDVRPRARVLCVGDGVSVELDLLAADWIQMTDGELAAEIEHATSARPSPR